ncbi:hypothetical protein UG55_103961 [Frankia sp. EI5c]|nr:hypothetical protein UG55_103961 [Frankia sp. EI5c]
MICGPENTPKVPNIWVPLIRVSDIRVSGSNQAAAGHGGAAAPTRLGLTRAVGRDPTRRPPHRPGRGRGRVRVPACGCGGPVAPERGTAASVAVGPGRRSRRGPEIRLAGVEAAPTRDSRKLPPWLSGSICRRSPAGGGRPVNGLRAPIGPDTRKAGPVILATAMIGTPLPGPESFILIPARQSGVGGSPVSLVGPRVGRSRPRISTGCAAAFADEFPPPGRLATPVSVENPPGDLRRPANRRAAR